MFKDGTHDEENSDLIPINDEMVLEFNVCDKGFIIGKAIQPHLINDHNIYIIRVTVDNRRTDDNVDIDNI